MLKNFGLVVEIPRLRSIKGLWNVVPLESKLAQGLIDYLAGSTFSLSGESTEIGKGVFLLAPPSFSITRMMVTA
ncbi:cell division protein SepF (plasmid) [Acaryochloris marina S15]|nr:cell division protein SepF [Acaryochloris marina S15]